MKKAMKRVTVSGLSEGPPQLAACHPPLTGDFDPVIPAIAGMTGLT